MVIYPVLLLMAGVVAMDTTSGPQFLVSEPIVSCSVLGLLFGNPEAGLMLGIIFQLLWLGYLPLGGERFTDNNMAAFISTASLFSAADIFGFGSLEFNTALILVLLFGVLIGIIGLHLMNFERRLNGIRTEKLLSVFEHGENPFLIRWHFTGIYYAFIKGVLMAVIFVPMGIMLCGTVRILPPFILDSMTTALIFVWGAVAASAVLFYWIKGRTGSIITGLIGGILWMVFMMAQEG